MENVVAEHSKSTKSEFKRLLNGVSAAGVSDRAARGLRPPNSQLHYNISKEVRLEEIGEGATGPRWTSAHPASAVIDADIRIGRETSARAGRGVVRMLSLPINP
jgi:hypothetical protein